MFKKIKAVAIIIGKKAKKVFLITEKFLKRIFLIILKFLKRIFLKCKNILKIVFFKIGAFFKNIWKRVLNFKPITKIIIGIIIVTLIIGSVVINLERIARNNNLSSYNILLDTTSYSVDISFEEEFLASINAEQEVLDEVNNSCILFKVMHNNYNYYVDLLKYVKHTNVEFRDELNSNLTELNSAMHNVVNFYNNLVINVWNHIIVLYTLKSLDLVINTSISLLPNLENYINLYGNDPVLNKLET